MGFWGFGEDEEGPQHDLDSRQLRGKLYFNKVSDVMCSLSSVFNIIFYCIAIKLLLTVKLPLTNKCVL